MSLTHEQQMPGKTGKRLNERAPLDAGIGRCRAGRRPQGTGLSLGSECRSRARWWCGLRRFRDVRAHGMPTVHGRLEGYTIVCACHDWRFDVRTGRFLNATELGLTVHTTKLDAGKLFVHLGGKEAA